MGYFLSEGFKAYLEWVTSLAKVHGVLGVGYFLSEGFKAYLEWVTSLAKDSRHTWSGLLP